MSRIKLAIFVVLFVPGLAQAATITVCSNGCDYSEIQTAINAASSGDTIEVYDGIYDSAVMTKPLSIRGGRMEPGGSITKTGSKAPIIETLYQCDQSLALDLRWLRVNRTISECTVPPCSKCQDVGPIPVLGQESGSLEELLADAKKIVSEVHTDLPGSSSKLLYTQDFSGRGLSWGSGSTERYTVDCREGKLYIAILEPYVAAYVLKPTPGRFEDIFNDFVIEIDVAQEGGTENNLYGLVLRFIDTDHYYLFKISGEGRYGFDKWENGMYIPIVPWTESTLINKGRSANSIKVECKGDTFTYYANGIKLGECVDSSFASGEIGLLAGSLEVGNVQVSFDNLNIYSI